MHSRLIRQAVPSDKVKNKTQKQKCNACDDEYSVKYLYFFAHFRHVPNAFLLLILLYHISVRSASLYRQLISDNDTLKNCRKETNYIENILAICELNICF